MTYRLGGGCSILLSYGAAGLLLRLLGAGSRPGWRCGGGTPAGPPQSVLSTATLLGHTLGLRLRIVYHDRPNPSGSEQAFDVA